MHEPLPVPELFQYGKIIVGLVFIFFLLTLPPSYFFWAIFLSIFILYEPTRWRLQYYIWEINSFGQVPGRFTVVLTSNDAIHIYCPEAKFLISRLAIRVFGPLSDPKSTLNYVAWRTCLAFAKDFEPQQICPGRQEIANYFNSTPPYIHVKPFLAGLVRGVVNEGEGAPNGMALNEAFVEEYMHTFSRLRYLQVELYILITIFHESMHCLTKHFFGTTVSPPSCGSAWSADTNGESGFVTEALLAGGRVVLQHLKYGPEDWSTFHSLVFQSGTVNQCSTGFCEFGIGKIQKYLNCFGRADFRCLVFDPSELTLKKSQATIEDCTSPHQPLPPTNHHNQSIPM